MSGDFARAGEALRAIAEELGRVRYQAMIGMARPLVDRLSRIWAPEAEALAGLNYPNMRAFWACELGLAERRRHGPPWRRCWQIRLTEKGWAEA